MAVRGRLPKELRKLLVALTYEDKLRKFRYAHERAPQSEEELNEFIFEVARELYHAEYDEWPENDEELA
jgi:hypothetical protein